MDASRGHGATITATDGEEEEDDYMNMTFEEPVLVKETSLQRTERRKKESLARGIIKSKAQLAAEEAEAREKALSTSLLDTAAAKKSKGFAMMSKMGFKGGSLGKKQADSGAEGGDAEGGRGRGRGPGVTEPIKLSIKEDRGGIGLESEKKRKLQEAALASDAEGRHRDSKSMRVDPDEYRERVRRERQDERLEKQVYAAQRVAERMDEETRSGSPGAQPSASTAAASWSSRPLKSIPLLYRGLVRYREEKERDRRMRHDLEQSLSRLPTYDDDDEDHDDRRALGKTKTAYVTAEDLDDEDNELDEFNALAPADRLERLVLDLRERHRYCFWCKMQYESESMEGCPGVTEEDHD